MLNNPNCNVLAFRKGILGYTFIDCSQKTTQTMSLIDNVFFIEVFKAVVLELKKDLYVCSTEPYNYSSTEIKYQNKLSEMPVSQNELATDISYEVKSLQPRNLKAACDAKRKQLNEEFFPKLGPTESLFLKAFIFSESDITDSQLQHT